MLFRRQTPQKTVAQLAQELRQTLPSVCRAMPGRAAHGAGYGRVATPPAVASSRRPSKSGRTARTLQHRHYVPIDQGRRRRLSQPSVRLCVQWRDHACAGQPSRDCGIPEECRRAGGEFGDPRYSALSGCPQPSDSRRTPWPHPTYEARSTGAPRSDCGARGWSRRGRPQPTSTSSVGTGSFSGAFRPTNPSRSWLIIARLKS